MTDVLASLGPIFVSVAISLAGAWAISRYAGPAQAAYVQALEKRLSVVTAERDDAEKEIPDLRTRISGLEAEVADLQRKTGEKDREIADLYRRLDADERRLAADERRARRLAPGGRAMIDFADRVLNPGVLVVMVLAGAGYGWTFLWAVDIRDCVRLYLVAVVPGIAFFAALYAIRVFQGTSGNLYPLLAVDWMVFANIAFLTVLGRRWMRRRRT